MAHPVLVDPVGFQQLILNVVKNGIDACTEAEQRSPMIMVQLSFRPNDIVLRVEDNGTGIDESAEVLQRAFYSTKDQGLGLGLAICRDVVKSHHGTLVMKNAESGGCMVEIVFPTGGADEVWHGEKVD